MTDRRPVLTGHVRGDGWVAVEDVVPGLNKDHFTSPESMKESGFIHEVYTLPTYLAPNAPSNMLVFNHMVENDLIHGDAAMMKYNGNDRDGYPVGGRISFGFTLLTDAITFKLLKASPGLK